MKPRKNKVLAGDRVTIKVGDEKGSWGIVQLVPARRGEYHVGIAGSHSDVRVYARNEIRKARN